MPPTAALSAQETLQRLRRMCATLSRGEIWWRDHQQWLQEHGYMLRPRYRPDWIPSWEGKDDMDPTDCEDSIATNRAALMDATRLSDGKIVKLKKIVDATHPHELEINQLFSSEPLASHPLNHCVPVYDVLDVPGEDGVHVIVMPLLRAFNDPPLYTIGEAIEFFDQIFHGLQFIHQCKIAHRDCMDLNIMMDPTPMFPQLFHPQEDSMNIDLKGLAKARYTRTERPTRYYIIDFGLSADYDPDKGETTDTPLIGGDKTVPEYQNNDDQPHEVYPTDVYYIGNMVRESFLQIYNGLEFMQPLIDDMVQNDPKKRPTMDEVVRRFAEIRRKLSWWKLRSRLIAKRGAGRIILTVSIKHFFRTIRYIATFRSATPTP